MSERKEDRDLERRVLNFLADRHIQGLRQIEIEADSGTVTMRGTVHSFYEKQMSQHCCRRVAGVIHLIDEITVEEQVPQLV